MAKRTIRDEEITNLNQDWGGTNPDGTEWGMKKERVEAFLKAKLQDHEAKISQKVSGVNVNNDPVPQDANGAVTIYVPQVSGNMSDTSNPDAAQAGAVARELNAIKNNAIANIELGDTNEDGSKVALLFFNSQGNEIEELRVWIPAGEEIGEIIQPVVTTELLVEPRVKLGDSISLRWTYSCIKRANGSSEPANYAAQTVTITAMIGMTTVYTKTIPNVQVNHSEEITLDPEIINQVGTVNISVVAATPIPTATGEDTEIKTSRSSKSVTVITMSLSTTFDPAGLLTLSGGYTDESGQISIPYAYSVPLGTILHVWLDGEVFSTQNISGNGRNYIYINASEMTAGRHNVQMVAESTGLMSDVVCVDFLKAGGTTPYIGLRLSTMVAQLTNMPLSHSYGQTAVPVYVNQFEEIDFDLGAWNAESLNSVIEIYVDGIITQTLSVDRTLLHVTQRFDTSGAHTMTIQNGTSVLTFGVTVNPASGVTESEASGVVTKLSATGRSNSESNPADWGGITSFEGVDWRTNGWNRGSDGVEALLLSNGAKAVIDVKPFVIDQMNGYSIQNSGMTLEMEIMVSQVIERGATIVHCLCDNEGNGYPMGIRVTTEEAGLFFGGTENIKTAEKVTDSEGNYLDENGNITDEDHAADLYIIRPHGVSMNIAIDKWVHLAFNITKVSGNRGIAMLYINGVLSRANTYLVSLVQNTPMPITINSDKADVRVRGLRYYRISLTSDEVLGNWIIDRPTAQQIQTTHQRNAVGDSNNSSDSDGNIIISHDNLVNRGRGVLTIIRSMDTIDNNSAAGTGTGLSELFRCTDKKANFKADLVKWEPPLDGNGNKIGEGFEARNIRVRIQGTSSVKYPYKNIRLYLTTQQGDDARSLVIGGVDVTSEKKGYPLRGSGNSIAQTVICLKTDFVDSSLVMNTGGAHLFHNIMNQLQLRTPPQEIDSRVRQAIDGLPCDLYAGTDEFGTLMYMGQFVLNNEKSKSGGIFGMEKVSGFSGTNENPISIALEALTNTSPMTLFHPAGSANSQALNDQLAAEFDEGFEFNFPEDATWATIGTGDYANWSGAQTAIKRLMGWIYDCMLQTVGVTGGTMTIASPDYGTPAGWSATSIAKWVCTKFKTEASQYFDINHLLTYYLFTDYWASVDQRAKNIIWRTWDGLKWYSTYYDGDTAVGIRNDAFLVYLYNVTRDTYDTERSKYAFEGHSSWLWCLVIANFEEELRTCASTLRNNLSNDVMLNEFNNVMQGNWSERQYNKSGKLKYIDTIDTLNYVYTLTGNRELHRTQFIIDRARLLDARYTAGSYTNDIITLTVANPNNNLSLKLKSGDLYYFGWKISNRWGLQPTLVAAGDELTMVINNGGTNDPQHITGASCIKELDLTNLGSHLNGTLGLSECKMMTKLVIRSDVGVANAPITLGNTSKLEYVDITGQTSMHTGTAGIFDISKHTRLSTFLAGGTSLTRIILPEGAPIETLTLPSTLQYLNLRYLPKLRHEGLTLESTTNIVALNFVACPYLSWQSIMDMCPNINKVRIEGMSGKARSSMLRRFMVSGFHGIDQNGSDQYYPALIGKVQLIDVVDDFETMRSFFATCGLELVAAQYSHYIFDDLVDDPANITNEDNMTGYDYNTGEYPQSGREHYVKSYVASGHISLLREKSQICEGHVNALSHKMHVTRLKKTGWPSSTTGTVEAANGVLISLNDENNEGYDIFLYLPKYWYKGVNDYKNARKHFFLSANDTCPSPSGTSVKYLMSEVQKLSGKAVYHVSGNPVEGTIDDYLVNDPNSECSAYKVSVNGMKQVRFPGILHSYYGFAFTDEDGNIISIDHLTMETSSGNPADFMNNEGDYDFRDVPENAKFFYFTCRNVSAAKNHAIVVVTDSTDIEAIEPDWVEHKAELIGIYLGFAKGLAVTSGGTPTSGLRSISNVRPTRGGSGTATAWTYDANGIPTALPNGNIKGNARDLYNLATIRGVQSGVLNGEYSLVPYETMKDMANLLMVWLGTRETEVLVGRGQNSFDATGVRNSIGFGDSSYVAQSKHNKMWGLECWIQTLDDYVDNICFNDVSFKEFRKNKRVATSAALADYYANILQQDGNERRVKIATNSGLTNVARVRFGRYCDIIASSYAGDTTYATFYAAGQSSPSTNKGSVTARSGYFSNVYSGVVMMSNDISPTGNGYSYIAARLCFQGEIENESDLLID